MYSSASIKNKKHFMINFPPSFYEQDTRLQCFICTHEELPYCVHSPGTSRMGGAPRTVVQIVPCIVPRAIPRTSPLTVSQPALNLSSSRSLSPSLPAGPRPL